MFRYAPVLRPLRAVAQVFTLKAPRFQTLAKRLYEICQREGLKADLRTMMALCELTSGDMRSAINTLQFLKTKTDFVTYAMILKLDVGSKDITKNLFKVWETIFMIPNARQMKKVEYLVDKSKNSVDLQDNNENNLYISRIASIIHAHGDYNLIMQGNFFRIICFIITRLL